MFKRNNLLNSSAFRSMSRRGKNLHGMEFEKSFIKTRKHSSKCSSSGKMISSAVVEVVRNYERTMNDFFYDIEINIYVQPLMLIRYITHNSEQESLFQQTFSFFLPFTNQPTV